VAAMAAFERKPRAANGGATRTASACVALLLLLGACEDKVKLAADEQRIQEQGRKIQEQAWAAAEQEQKARAQRAHEQAVAAAREAQANETAQAKAALRADPTRFLKTSDLGSFDKGIINSYRQLSKLSVLNTSKYSVTGMRGQVDWTDAQGKLIGSTAISLAGALPAGDMKTFSTRDGTLQGATLQGAATNAAVRFTSVDIVEAP
jgi:hypothetical protein